MILRKEYLLFLDELKDVGVDDDYKIKSCLRDEFPELNNRQARHVIAYWKNTFDERQRG